MGLKHAEVTAILGPVDDILLSEIIATGASAQELAEATAWISNDEALVGDGRHLSRRVAALIDLLLPDDDDDWDPGEGLISGTLH